MDDGLPKREAQRAPSGAASPRAVAPDRRDDAFRRAKRHSRRVRILKILLPVSAVVVAVAFFAVTRIASINDFGVAVSGIAVSDGNLVMSNPKMEGVNRDNRPYSMRADRAVQDGLVGGLVKLEGIDAKMPIGNDAFAMVEASRAFYDRDNNTIMFDQDLVVTTTDGMTVKLRTATMDIEKGDMSTNDAVSIKLVGTDIAASSMTVLENGKILIFENNVRMDIRPRQLKSAQHETGGADGG